MLHFKGWNFCRKFLTNWTAIKNSTLMRALVNAPENSTAAERLWKVLTYFDRMLFCPRPGGRTTRRGGAKHRRTEPEPEHESGWSATLAERIRLMSDGAWSDLWRETVSVSYAVQDPEKRGGSESAEQRRIRRATALWEDGELSRACAAALPSLDPLRGDDILLKLRDLFPARPLGDRMPCLLYTSPSPRDKRQSRMPSSA